VAPRTMVRPRVLFSSDSIICAPEPLPGAEGLFCLRLTRRNSSVSARTRFMCYRDISVVLGVVSGKSTLSNASIWPVMALPSCRVTRMRQLM
jgi:hypothetical protein